MRLFISIEAPPAVIEQSVLIQNTLKQLNIFEGTYVAPQTMHITLAFLGEVADEKLSDIILNLEKLRFKQFEVKTDGIGVNSWHHTTVIWLKILSQELGALASEINSCLKDYVQRENREFKSHLTLARIKNVRNKRLLQDILENLSINPILSWQINEFYLKQSVLSEAGVTHTIIKKFALFNQFPS